jgi:isopentenyl diphosphate isomerase/L-lactate dehydrogenase-like FMN-dependent dehydrogenase
MASAPQTYGNEVYANGLQNIKPAISFNPHDWETHARDGLRETDTNNRDAFRKWALIPSRLVSADFPSLKTTVLGQEYAYPIAVAPIGVQRIFHRDGEVAAAKAASEQHVPCILSTASATSIEDVAAASGDGARWYQLYWPPNEHNEITVSPLERVKRAGYRVLVVTLDTYILGWRPSDLNNGYNPFLRADKMGVELGFSDPVFRRRFRERHGVEVEEDMSAAATEWAHMIFPGWSHSWEEIGFLQTHWDGPIVLKGIQSVADARRAVEVGVQGIVVSNHVRPAAGRGHRVA